ncbi:hypothetical protein PAMP_009720 [Pampus punctatissimus]
MTLSVGMQLCAVETGVIQAVSGSCDPQHPAQQLETTYITQLLYESCDSLDSSSSAGGNASAGSGLLETVNRATPRGKKSSDRVDHLNNIFQNHHKRPPQRSSKAMMMNFVRIAEKA